MAYLIVKLPDSVHQSFKAACAKEGKAMSAVVLKAIVVMLNVDGKEPRNGR